MNTYHVICLYRTGEQYIDEVEAESPKAAWDQAQTNAIVNNARPVPTEAEILKAGQDYHWDFSEPALSKYWEYALELAAIYQVVEQGTLDSHNLKLVEYP